MRHIDYYLGGTLCLMLDVVERLRRRFISKRLRPEPRTIIVTKYLGIGSILLATPAFKALKSRYPSSRIILLTFEANTTFASRLPFFSEVIAIRTSSLQLFVLDTLHALRKIRQLHADYILDLEFFARFSTIVSYLSGAACRVGYYMPQVWRGDLLDILVHFNPYRHVTEIFAAQIEALGIKVEDLTITPPAVDRDAVARVKTYLDRCGVKDEEQIIVINVNASDLSIERRWPKENFAALINALAVNSTSRYLFIGSVGEQDHVQSVYDSLSPEARSLSINLAGKQTLDELIALLSLADACISNDSGPLHIAAALGTPTFSFFGPESPLLYGPQGSGHTVFYAGLYCSPCLSVFNAKKAMCHGNNVCMQAITPEQAIEGLLPRISELHGRRKTPIT